jgi:hypothetical protein
MPKTISSSAAPVAACSNDQIRLSIWELQHTRRERQLASPQTLLLRDHQGRQLALTEDQVRHLRTVISILRNTASQLNGPGLTDAPVNSQ